MPSTINVVNTVTGANQTGGFKRAYSAKVDSAFGRVASTGYAVGDTLKFASVNAKEIVYAKFVAGTASLEVFNATDLASPLTFDIQNSGATANIDYVVHFVRGSNANAIQLTIASSS